MTSIWLERPLPKLHNISKFKGRRKLWGWDGGKWAGGPPEKKKTLARPMRAVDGEHWEYKYWINALNPPESKHLFQDNHLFVATKPWGPKKHPKSGAYPFGLLWQVWQLGEARSKPIFNTCSWEDKLNNLPKDMFFSPERKYSPKMFPVGKKDKKTSSDHCFLGSKECQLKKSWDSSHTPWKQPYRLPSRWRASRFFFKIFLGWPLMDQTLVQHKGVVRQQAPNSAVQNSGGSPKFFAWADSFYWETAPCGQRTKATIGKS